MTEMQRKMLEMVGATEKDTQPKQSADERIQELEEQNAMLIDCLLEISEIIYA